MASPVPVPDGPDRRSGALSGLRVVELEGSVAGSYCTKLLADQGASVTLLVHPDAPHRPTGHPPLDLFLNRSSTGPAKNVHVVAPSAGETPGGWAAAASPVGEVLDAVDPDVVVQSSAPDPLARCGAVERWARRPTAIAVEISPFGSTGPWATYRSTDATDQAISGHLWLTGDPDRPPLAGPEHQVGYAAGLNAAIGVLAALLARHRDGTGQRVEVAHQEVMAALHQFTLLRYTHNGDVLRRMGNRYAGPGRPIGAYRCGDRMISLVVPRDDQLDRLLAVAGLDHLLERPGIESTYDLMHHPTLLDEHLVPWLAAQDHDETIQLLQDLRIPAGPVSTMGEVLADPQLVARGFWIDASGPSVRLPAPPALFTRKRTATASPIIEGVRSEVDAGAGPLAGLRVLDLTRVWAGPLATRILADLGADVTMIEAPWARGPAGIDRSSVLATHYYPDDDPGSRHWNRIGFVNKYGLNKRSVAMDLTDPECRSAFESMVARVDVVIENYSPRVMPQLGLDEDRLHELNPSLVYVTMPGFGRTGPSADRVAYGPIIDSHAGLSVLQGYVDEPARKGGIAWPDPVAGLHAALATLVALVGNAREAGDAGDGGNDGREAGNAGDVHNAREVGDAGDGGNDVREAGNAGDGGSGGLGRARVGDGGADTDQADDEPGDEVGTVATVELAQLEATVALVGHALAERQLSGHEPRRLGNRHARYAPQGVYRCAGDDRWLALTVVDDDSWRQLCTVARLDPGWAGWTVDDRRRHHDEIDAALERFTAPCDHVQLMHRLQAAGVPAAAVADAPMVMADPHLRARGFFVAVEHPEAGTHEWPACPIRLDATPASIRRPAPTLGQHNREVLTELALLDVARIAALEQRGVVTDRPPD